MRPSVFFCMDFTALSRLTQDFGSTFSQYRPHAWLLVIRYIYDAGFARKRLFNLHGDIHATRVVTFVAEELGAMSNNKLREISLIIRPIWGINFLILHRLDIFYVHLYCSSAV